MNYAEISEEAFLAIFQPIKNHLNPNAAFDFGEGGTMFETYGEELAHVQSQPAARIWTLVEGDDGLELTSGFHFVNRLGYIITQHPVQPGLSISISLEEENSIAIRWHIEDVACVYPELSDEESREVLRRIKKNHDAEIGVNWDVIRHVANDLFPATAGGDS